jgi:hypothetical protein
LPPIQFSSCCLSILNSLQITDAAKLCYDTIKSHVAWNEARKLRISGSRIYSIFTYSKNVKPNWEQKSKSYFWPKEIKNKYVKLGLMQEQFAINEYEKVIGQKVVKCGFVVHPQCPWVGYSPDGIIFGANGPKLLLEIKCPYEGKTKTINDCLNCCSFLEKDYT